jgi:hypothetical protein
MFASRVPRRRHFEFLIFDLRFQWITPNRRSRLIAKARNYEVKVTIVGKKLPFLGTGVHTDEERQKAKDRTGRMERWNFGMVGK